LKAGGHRAAKVMQPPVPDAAVTVERLLGFAEPAEGSALAGEHKLRHLGGLSLNSRRSAQDSLGLLRQRYIVRPSSTRTTAARSIASRGRQVLGEGVAESSNRLGRVSLALVSKAERFPLPQESP
jgi:hypothetical protein